MKKRLLRVEGVPRLIQVEPPNRWSHAAGRNFLRWFGARLELGGVHGVFTRPYRGLALWGERRIALPLSNRRSATGL